MIQIKLTHSESCFNEGALGFSPGTLLSKYVMIQVIAATPIPQRAGDTRRKLSSPPSCDQSILNSGNFIADNHWWG